MNFIYISPNFPDNFWNFCDRLNRNGVTTLGIGDEAYDRLSDKLRSCLTEYYRVSNLENYDEVYRAVAFFTFKYGRIDWIESNNEYWLRSDAKLRDDFNIKTGFSYNEICAFQSKFNMRDIYWSRGVPYPDVERLQSYGQAIAFIERHGYPVIIKPEVGVGASHTYKICDEKQLEDFYKEGLGGQFIIEEFVDGKIYSYDAIINSKSEPLFESMTSWHQVLDTVNDCTDFYYYIAGEVNEALADCGRKVVKGFRLRSRFVHLEFFRLNADKAGLGKKGDFVGLEANLRVAGGYTSDMMNYAHSTDVHQIWADMITTDKRLLKPAEKEYYCVYVALRNRYSYAHTQEEVSKKYASSLISSSVIPKVLADDMGDRCYIAKFATYEELKGFASYALEKKPD